GTPEADDKSPKGWKHGRFFNYHQEKGRHTNDCHHLRRQLEAALESDKLNHLIKDVHQRGRGNQRGDDPQQENIINMTGIRSLKEKKRKACEAELAGYPVRRIYINGGASVEVMFEHSFENLCPAIKARLMETQTDLVGFAGEATKPLGKIELEVWLKALRSISSTIHSMMKFPTPRCIATLVTRSAIISKCRRLEKKQMVEGEKKEEVETKAVNMIEEILVNPVSLDQMAIIGGGLHETCKAQLKLLLKDNMDKFAWEPSDMMGVPRRVMEHNLNVNISIEPERQKRRVLAPEKSKVVTRDVDEWVKAGIIRPVRYPTWISNPVLVKKCNGDRTMCINFKNLNSAC
ncbi:hypothetical protein Tco_0030226, partial [Tanacetum coccineum]